MGGPDGIKLIQWGSTGQTNSGNEPVSKDYCLHKFCSFAGEIGRCVMNELGRLHERKGK